MPHPPQPRVVPSIPRRRFRAIPAAIGLVLMASVAFFLVMWFVIRVEVDANKILVLVNKTGKTLPPELAYEFGDQVVLFPALVKRIAAITGESEEEIQRSYKGIQYDVQVEGRYFPNPYSYKRIVQNATVMVFGAKSKVNG